MYKVVVVTDPESADGFRLSGVEVIEVEEGNKARAKLAELLDDDTIGVIAFSSEFAPFIDERTQKKIDRIYRPIVVQIPSKKRVGIVGRADYLRGLIRRAIGFEIKLGEGE